MNPELKVRWIAKLRSGERRQGKGALRKKSAYGDTFCCLGVLCEIAVEDGVIAPPAAPEGIGWNYLYVGGESALLPYELEEWSGTSEKDRQTLMGMNDSYGKTFEEIADWIEDNL